jgi:hypothetical protein
MLRSFESRGVAASSNAIQALPAGFVIAIYQFCEARGAGQVQFGSAILNGFPGIFVFG